MYIWYVTIICVNLYYLAVRNSPQGSRRFEMAKESKYRDVIKSTEYRKLLLTNLVNRFGDSVDAIAFTWLVYQITQSASWSAIIFGLNMLPNIIIQPFAGPIIEKLDKKKVIVTTHILRGIVISAFVALYAAGIVNPYLMAGFTLLITTIESFNLPASTAFIPSVIKKEHLTHGMSLNSTLSNAVALIGTGLGGVIVAKFGVLAAMLIDAATFFIAAAGTSTIRRLNENEESEAGSQAAPAAKESYFELLKGGVKYIAKNRVIVNYCFIVVILNFFLVPINSLSAPIAEEVFGLGSEFLSVLGMASSIGALLGSAVVPMLSEKMAAKNILVVFGLVLGGGMYALSLGRYFYGKPLAGYLLAGACYIVMCFAASVLGGVIGILFVKVVDQNYLARAGAIFNASATAAMPLGSIIVSAVAIKLNPAHLIAASAVLAIVLFLLVAVSNLKFEMTEENLDAVESV